VAKKARDTEFAFLLPIRESSIELSQN